MQGPIAAASPGVAIPLTSKYTNYEGAISYTRPDRITCTGRWTRPQPGAKPSRAALNPAGLASGSGEVPHDGGIHIDSTGWGYVDHGNRTATATGAGACSNGATFQFSFVADGVNAKGMLYDSDRNIYILARSAKPSARAAIQALASERNPTAPVY